MSNTRRLPSGARSTLAKVASVALNAIARTSVISASDQSGLALMDAPPLTVVGGGSRPDARMSSKLPDATPIASRRRASWGVLILSFRAYRSLQDGFQLRRIASSPKYALVNHERWRCNN